MSNAYQCDRCGSFETATHAPVYLDIEDLGRMASGDVVLEDGTRVSWSREDTNVEFCPECAVELIEHVDEYLTEATDE